ncbi:MAG: hypothetical protein VX990_05675 [Pseudomonadota bacterium]|nr:hypothetical protein [Pseudomonadota bacterium]
MAKEPYSQKRLPNQEGLLLEYVHQLEKHRKGRRAVHLHLSALSQNNRREQHIQTAAGNFEPLIKDEKGQMFVLKNSDLFFVFEEAAKLQTETVIQDIRFLFDDDPLFTAEEKADQPFATWYDADKDYDNILHLVQGLAQTGEKGQTEARSRTDARSKLKAKQEQGEPLTPEVLEQVITALVRADLSNLVRRQFICQVDTNMVPEQEFSELFISIKDVRETILPKVNLVANRWLFQHLTETLDKRMLSMLSKTDSISMSGNISFNVNVTTLLSREFLTFDDNIAASRRGSMTIELQKEDIFNDLSAFVFAREFVKEKGFRVCLDGLNLQTLLMVNTESLGVDMVKLIWDPELVDSGEDAHDQLRSIIKQRGDRHLILCRCDDRQAVDFGHAMGLQLFQGRFVENLIVEDGRRRELLKLQRRIERGSEASVTQSRQND